MSDDERNSNVTTGKVSDNRASVSVALRRLNELSVSRASRASVSVLDLSSSPIGAASCKSRSST